MRTIVASSVFVVALAVLAGACDGRGSGQTITGPPIVSILSTRGPINIGPNGQSVFGLSAATGLTLGGCSGWTRISASRPTQQKVVIDIKATSDRCPRGAAFVAPPTIALLGLPAISCPMAPITVVVRLGGHLEQSVAKQPNRVECG